MTKDFNDWWDADRMPLNNPYREDSAAYWAWAGWVVGAKAERKAVLDILWNYAGRKDLTDEDQSLLTHLNMLILARGKV